MLKELMFTTGWLFWTFTALFLLVDVLFLSFEKHSVALGTTAVGLVLAFLFTDLFERASLWWLVIGAVIYLLIGIIWSFFRWWEHLHEKLAEATTKFNSESETTKADYGGTVRAYAERRGLLPTATKESDRLMAWIGLWPFSMAYSVLKRPWQIVKAIYARLSTAYDRMTDRIWGK